MAIAEALDLSVIDLMRFDHDRPEELKSGEDRDATTLLTILHELNGKPVSGQLVQDSAGWSAPQLQLATQAANVRLNATGFRVIRDEEDLMALVRSSEVSSRLDSDAVGRVLRGVAEIASAQKPLDSFKVAAFLAPLAHGASVDAQSVLDQSELDRLVEEGVIECCPGDSRGYWFSAATINPRRPFGLADGRHSTFQSFLRAVELIAVRTCPSVPGAKSSGAARKAMWPLNHRSYGYLVIRCLSGNEQSRRIPMPEFNADNLNPVDCACHRAPRGESEEDQEQLLD